MTPDDYPEVRTVQLCLCQDCLDGKGWICHTPGCALCRRMRPDFALNAEEYEDVTDVVAENARLRESLRWALNRDIGGCPREPDSACVMCSDRDACRAAWALLGKDKP